MSIPVLVYWYLLLEDLKKRRRSLSSAGPGITGGGKDRETEE